MKNERPVDIRNRPRIPVPDEDPYSVAGDGVMTRKSSSDFIDLFVSRLRLQWLQRCQGEIKGQAAEVAAPRLDLWPSRSAQHSQGIHIFNDRDTPDGGAAPVLDVQSSDDWRP